MAKELVLAILLGSFLGFGLAGTSFGIKKIVTKATIGPKISAPTPNQVNPTADITISQIPEASPVPTIVDTNNSNSLSITSPTNYLLVSDQVIEIVGKSAPNYSVLIQNGNKDYLTTADNSGQFKQQISLNQNLNLITITSIGPDNQEKSLNLTITYTNAKI